MSHANLNDRWDDVIGFAALRASGAAAADFSAWQPGGSGGLRAYEFSSSALKELYVFMQFPHGVKFGSVVKPHVHFTTRATTSTGVVRWQLEYSIKEIGGTFSAPSTIGGSYTFDANNQDKNLVQAIDSGTITLPANSPSVILVGRLFRDGGTSPDTFAASVFLVGFDFHAQFDKPGTIGELSPP